MALQLPAGCTSRSVQWPHRNQVNDIREYFMIAPVQQKQEDSRVDAIAAVATVVLFVVTVLFWISNQ